jgi:H+/Cl- antiporter ClcA
MVKSKVFIFFTYVLKWLSLSTLVGLLVGSASAIFLINLDWVTSFRESHPLIIWLLPLSGLGIAAAYNHWGSDVSRGNNIFIEEIDDPKRIVPIKMALLVYFGTIATHLFGGSAGREGTAVQMGGSIADQFTKYFKLENEDRKLILIAGISAGFASIFGTPLAGTVFALEVLYIGRIRYHAIVPAFIAAFVAHYTCEFWPIHHTAYSVGVVPMWSIYLLGWSALAGVIFGLCSRLFSLSMHKLADLFLWFKNPMVRTFIGGLLVVAFVYYFETTKFIGLGIPTIIEAFSVRQGYEVFLIKILLTVITLSAGFKGGEVTPLFFIGATLGSALSLIIPLPIGLLAGMGFVAVFAGATNTPIACIVMGVELFGIESVVYLIVACSLAYLCSGHKGIYLSQRGSKWEVFRKS